jgi:hypothetical protein
MCGFCSVHKTTGPSTAITLRNIRLGLCAVLVPSTPSQRLLTLWTGHCDLHTALYTLLSPLHLSNVLLSIYFTPTTAT